ncbi:MAG TPA: penicillin-binding protein 2 [Solirubrobacteraceae bacterium]|nr:penicillin-binding protein 2 [Solirubrobacteraceae bacterium]
MNLIDRRIGLLFLAFLSLLGIAVLRATYLGAVRAGTLQRAAATQQVSTETLPAERGSITDRNGVELAISQAADDVAADPYLIKDPQGEAAKLSPLLGRPVLTLISLLTKRRTGFVYLAHLVPGDRASQVTKLKLPGLTLMPQIRRIYPRTWAASQVLGTVGWGDHGQSGVEFRYDAALRGSVGVRRVVNDAIGQPVEIDDVRPTVPGKPVRLTIDAALQDEVEQVLAGVGAQYSPRGATAIAMDPNTGAILALANWPRINANDLAGAPGYANQNRAVSFNYEPGSTFKAFTVAGALQDGVVTPDTRFDVPSVLQVADRQIHDAEVHGDENLSVADILRVSSNIGATEIGMKVGASRFDYWVHRFGFGAHTGVDLPGEERGIVLHAAQYSGSSMGNLPMGQGESVTPIQMATAYAAIANGGTLRPAHVVAAIGGKPTKLPAGKNVIASNTAAELRQMLRGVFADGGTASGAAIKGYDLAGKTGTAQMVVNGQYSKTQYIASFIGFVPASRPRLLVAVMVDEPQGSIYGGSVAAPAFQKIVGWAVPYLGISPR